MKINPAPLVVALQLAQLNSLYFAFIRISPYFIGSHGYVKGRAGRDRSCQRFIE